MHGRPDHDLACGARALGSDGHFACNPLWVQVSMSSLNPCLRIATSKPSVLVRRLGPCLPRPLAPQMSLNKVWTHERSKVRLCIAPTSTTLMLSFAPKTKQHGSTGLLPSPRAPFTCLRGGGAGAYQRHHTLTAYGRCSLRAEQWSLGLAAAVTMFGMILSATSNRIDYLACSPIVGVWHACLLPSMC